MKFLIENDFVMSLANNVWGNNVNADVSSQTCLTQFPVMKMGCWTGLMAKSIGILIIVASCINKAPVIRNILDSKSAAGLSRMSVYGDLLVSANGAFYGILEGHPFTAFGENCAIVIQTAIIVLLIWQFSRVQSSEKSMLAVLAALYCVVIMVLPKDLNYLLQASITPIYLYSRGLQVLETFRIQHTGALSIATISMSLAGSAIRILTTIQEVGMDLAVLGNYGLGVAMNLMSFIQYFYFRSNTEKFLRNLTSKKSE
jgi:mannose-P-dolichol utilization defect 1